MAGVAEDQPRPVGDKRCPLRLRSFIRSSASIDNGAVELVEPQEYPFLGFYSRLFVVPKPGRGNWHPLIDLSMIHKFMTVPKCKFETPKPVLHTGRGIG